MPSRSWRRARASEVPSLIGSLVGFLLAMMSMNPQRRADRSVETAEPVDERERREEAAGAQDEARRGPLSDEGELPGNDEDERTSSRAGHEHLAPDRERHQDTEDGGSRGEPDVLLDVPSLRVREIDLKVAELRAHVALHARVADLVSLDAGTDVSIGKVELQLKEVEARAILKVRLREVYKIIERTLATVDRNPKILEMESRLGHELGEPALRTPSEGALSALEEAAAPVAADAKREPADSALAGDLDRGSPAPAGEEISNHGASLEDESPPVIVGGVAAEQPTTAATRVEASGAGAEGREDEGRENEGRKDEESSSRPATSDSSVTTAERRGDGGERHRPSAPATARHRSSRASRALSKVAATPRALLRKARKALHHGGER